ncbi:MAG: hypothetical protein SFX72_12000 [Isosphaeraceae bacterium]|nr:hypothetical protein [Isosphaeraceae bacterium]
MDFPPARTEPKTGWRIWTLLVLGYVLALGVATFPRVLQLVDTVPTNADPAQHLWVMEWYKTCLLEGKLPFYCPDVQYPVGASLGNFSPMILQAALYIPLSTVVSHDVLAYNLLWIAAFLFCGLSTYRLAVAMTGERLVSAFSGLAAMLAAPMMLHGIAHLELISLGVFPAFLLAWMNFVDEPGLRRLLFAAGMFFLVACGAAYFAVMGVVPAVLYVAVRCVERGRGGMSAWIVSRLHWLAGFAGLSLIGSCLAFSNQIWAATHGQAMVRGIHEFTFYRSPFWTYFTPTPHHLLDAVIPVNPYVSANLAVWAHESGSYLGVVVIGLMIYAASRRSELRQRGFFWLGLVVMVVLSMGAYQELAFARLPMPALWLWKVFPPFRLIRVPARFNLLALVFAAILASAGLRDLLARLRHRLARIVLTSALVALTVADLSVSSYRHAQSIPPAPRAYQEIALREPHAAVLELPAFHSSECLPLTAFTGYWQKSHGLRTTGGYSGVPNAVLDDLFLRDCALNAVTPTDCLGASDDELRGRLWLQLHEHDIRYMVLHVANALIPDHVAAESIPKCERVLRGAEIYRDDAAVVYDRDALAPPSSLTWIRKRGWRRAPFNPRIPLERLYLESAGEIVVFSPREETVRFQVEGWTLGEPRVLSLRSNGSELARLVLTSRKRQSVEAGPFYLPAGLSELTVVDLAASTDEPASTARSEPTINLTRVALSLDVTAPHAAAERARPDSVVR